MSEREREREMVRNHFSLLALKDSNDFWVRIPDKNDKFLT